MRQPLFFQKPFRYSYYNATIILLVLNAMVFVIQFAAQNLSNTIYTYLVLTPSYLPILNNYWSFFTYMFVHIDFFHFFFNMFALFMFGLTIEKKLGSTEFLLFYLLTGLLVGITLYLVDIAFGISTIGQPASYLGASGAIYAVFLAFATFFPNATIRIWFILPVKAYILIIGLTAFSIISQLFGFFGTTSHLGHLAGLLFGFLYFIIRFGINPIKEFINARRYY